MEEQNVKKLSVCVLFGGVSPEHEVSLRSAESVLNNLDKEKYNIFPVGITKTGEWILYGGRDYSKLPTGEWQHCPENRRAAISPVRGQGLLNFGATALCVSASTSFSLSCTAKTARTAPFRACCS